MGRWLDKQTNQKKKKKFQADYLGVGDNRCLGTGAVCQ